MFELVFFTSSRVKLAHAQYLSRNYAVSIVSFREKTFGATYSEPRIHNRKELIDLSYEDARHRWLKNSTEERIFFIEDTSVKIDALSDEQETPGLDIKYWMEEMSFEKLDAQLKRLGNNRNVTVRSDVVLHLPPGLSDEEGKSYKQFTSIVSGRVVDYETLFETNPVYPWLDNKTFNKWFAPETQVESISKLPISEADKYDFRKQAFCEMLGFLEQKKIIFPKSFDSIQTQKNFDFGFRLFIISGPTCAGKTTLAEFLTENFGYYHIEASDFMHVSFYKRHGIQSSFKIGDFAQQALLEQPEIVADQILKNIRKLPELPIVITGFRSIKEIQWFQDNYSGKYQIEVLFISAEQKTRFKRSQLRNRIGESTSLDDFLKRDRQQADMGISELSINYLNQTIENNSNVENYFETFRLKYRDYLKDFRSGSSKVNLKPKFKLEDIILLTLNKYWDTKEFFTTTEIAKLINDSENNSPKSKNNISRYFNQSFHEYYEIDISEGKRRYRLSSTGRGKAQILTMYN